MADVAATSVVADDVRRALFPQAELLGLPAMPERQGEAVARRKAGRPPGARNRRDEDVARLLVERFGDPLAHLVAVATMDTEELALRLGCTTLEAAQEKRLAAQVAMPFLHSRMPVRVDVANHRVVHLTIQDAECAPHRGDTLEGVVTEVVEYQQVDGGEDATL